MATHADRGPVPARRGPTTPAWMIGAVILVIVAAVGVGVLIRANTGTERRVEAPASPGTVPASPATEQDSYAQGSAADELSRYVLQTFEGPKAAEAFEFNRGETWDLYSLANTFDIPAQDLLRAGFVDAYVTSWFTPGWEEGTGKDLISVAILFRDPAGAREGFALFDIESSWDRYRWLPTRGLGGDAIAAEGRIDGVATVSYAWRYDDLVLVVASQGSLSPEVVGPLAQHAHMVAQKLHG